MVCSGAALCLGIWHNQIGNYRWDITNPYLHLIIETIVSTLCMLFFEFTFKAYFRAKNEPYLAVVL
jgi:hypothetical protein